jgi:hypothetical protein
MCQPIPLLATLPLHRDAGGIAYLNPDAARAGLGVIDAAEQAGKPRRGQTVIEATSGNTGVGLATARYGALAIALTAAAEIPIIAMAARCRRRVFITLHIRRCER